MRTVTTLSLPATVAKEVKKEAKEQGFASTSDFTRHVLRTYKNEKLYVGLRNNRPHTAKILNLLRSCNHKGLAVSCSGWKSAIRQNLGDNIKNCLKR